MKKTYDSYKPFKLPWLREIPSHWKSVRNKNIFEEVKTTVGSEWSQFTLLSLTLNGIIPRDVESGKGKFPKEFDSYKPVKKGDMAFCLFDIDETPRTVGLSEYDGMLTGAYDIFHVKNVNSRFIYYYYLSLDNAKAMKPFYSGLRKTINIGTFLGLRIPVPPRSEQDQIVRYLDWQVSRIDKLIEGKKREIELIKEQKYAFVSRVITSGLNTKVPFKDSGVNWLKLIPAHWQIIKLRNILKSFSQKGRPDLQLLSVVREQGVIIRDIEDKTTNHNFIPDDLSTYKVVKKKQFVINKMKAWQGSYGISDYDGIVSPAYFVFDIRFPNLQFFHYAIRSKVYVNFFAQASGGIRVGQWDLSIDKMKTIPFFVPPEKEQQEIVAFIPRIQESLNSLVIGLQREIERLEEFKTRVISDVVTGKFDVRNISVVKK